MYGAIIGDIVGSRFEFNNTHDRDFEFFHKDCHVTDDSAMTLAVMKALVTGNLDDEEEFKKTVIASFKELYALIPDGDYGMRFWDWLEEENPKPYNSLGNGAVMRISPCSAVDPERRAAVTAWVTSVSHNHPIAMVWADKLTEMISTVRGMSKVADAKEYLQNELEKTVAEPQKYYKSDSGVADVVRPGTFDETTQGIMPLAITAVLLADDFEDAIRWAVAMGGDSDTIAAVAGSIAEAVFGIPTSIVRAAVGYIPVEGRTIIRQFKKKYNC